MAHILVIHARAAERRRITALLSRATDWSVVEADSEERALTMSRLVPLDLVLADCDAPELHAHALVERLAVEQPLLPIIVIAGRGRLEAAREALETAAAGYVAGHRLETDLVPVVAGVLNVAAENRMTLESRQLRQSTAFEMENDPASVAGVVRHVTGQCRRFGITNEHEQMRVAVALEEALLNAMIHGNLEVASSLRERTDDAFRRLIERRRMEPEYAARRVRLNCDVDLQQARIVIRDQGPGFDVRSLPDPRDPDYMLRASGRGVLLMRTFMDEVIYNDRGNEVTLVKRRRDVAAAQAQPAEQASSP